MEAGQLIAGRYRLDVPIGSGGHGVVWCAVDETLGRVVAVKRALPEDGGRDSQPILLVRREAKILAKLNHPNVVTLFDVVAEGAEWWLVMEFVPARNLADCGRLTPERAARIGAQIADGLAAVHAAGIVHRDVKPSNVFLTEDDRAKLGDFGVSRSVAGAVTLTDTGPLVAGTPGYTAPEVANGEDPSPASDVFSLGATLFAVTEGASPYGASGNPLALLGRAARREVDSPTGDNPLAPVLSELLRVDPVSRPTAAQARRILAELGAGGLADGDPGPTRRRVSLGVLIAAAAVVLVLVGWFVVADRFDSTRAGGPGSSTAPVSVVVGDTHTVDPCALTDPAGLGRFGDVSQKADAGDFNRCDVFVQPATGGEVDVKVELENSASPEMREPGQDEHIGSVTVVRQPQTNGQCHRLVRLPDTNGLLIEAKQGNGSADLCGIADVATASAVAVVSRGEIPRRMLPADRRSLIDVNACALPHANALDQFPGVDALHAEIDFGNWECWWNSTTSSDRLLVRFDRNSPRTAADGLPTRLGGHAAFVEPGGYDPQSCEVDIVYREYVDRYAQTTDELLLVVVLGPEPPDQLCTIATAIAGPTAANLPPL